MSQNDFPRPEPENILTGRNPIREALKAGRDMEKLLVARGDLSGPARQIIAQARQARIVVQEVERKRLDEITPNHQGMIAFVSAAKYYDVAELLSDAEASGKAPFFVALDGITDPHNVGAIARSACCAGANGLILCQRRAVGLTPAAVKASAGAFEYIKTARVVNLPQTLEALKEKGLWVYGADMDGADYGKTDFSGPMVLVIGSEGEGLSRLVRERCDHLVSIPMSGPLDSLNASCAAAILLFAARRSRP